MSNTFVKLIAQTKINLSVLGFIPDISLWIWFKFNPSDFEGVCKIYFLVPYVYINNWHPVHFFLSHPSNTLTSATSSPLSVYTTSPPFQSQISPPSPSPTTLPPSPSFSVPPIVGTPGESLEEVNCPLMLSPSALVVRCVKKNCDLFSFLS